MRYSIAWCERRVPGARNVPSEFIRRVISAWKSVQLDLLLLSVTRLFESIGCWLPGPRTHQQCISTARFHQNQKLLSALGWMEKPSNLTQAPTNKRWPPVTSCDPTLRDKFQLTPVLPLTPTGPGFHLLPLKGLSFAGSSWTPQRCWHLTAELWAETSSPKHTSPPSLTRLTAQKLLLPISPMPNSDAAALSVKIPLA